MTTTDLDVADHHAAGSLADELPYWGWLPDDRTCLTRRGELVTLARLVADRRGRPHPGAAGRRAGPLDNGCSQASTPGPGSISTCSAGRRPSPTPIPACRRSPTSGNGSGARSSRPVSNRLRRSSRGATTRNCRRPRTARAISPGGRTIWQRGRNGSGIPTRRVTSASRSRTRRRAFGNRSMPAARWSRTSPRSTSSRHTKAPASSRSW